MAKFIIGLTGYPASGKDTAARYFMEKYNAINFGFSDSLRDILDRLRIPQTRANMQKLSTVLRELFGQDLLSRLVAHDADEAVAELIVIDGARRLSDIDYLRRLDGFHLVGIKVEARIRYERLLKRSENPDDQIKTWEEFQQDEKAEADMSISELLTKADFSIDNAGTMEDLYKQLDALYQTLSS